MSGGSETRKGWFHEARGVLSTFAERQRPVAPFLAKHPDLVPLLAIVGLVTVGGTAYMVYHGYDFERLKNVRRNSLPWSSTSTPRTAQEEHGDMATKATKEGGPKQ